MTAASLAIATWNMEWKKPGSAESMLMIERLNAHAPDILCLTEAYREVADCSGHLIEAEADYGYPLVVGRRKVMLWSKAPWEEVDALGHPDLPSGRYIADRTMTPLGKLLVIGVCIPWREAHVRTGRRDREPWQDHCAYLAALRQILAAASGPALLVGDFNQRIPHAHTPRPVHAALLDALAPKFQVCTAGLIPPIGQAAIDHIAHTGEIMAQSISGLSNIGPDGTRLSDHFGIAAGLRLR